MMTMDEQTNNRWWWTALNGPVTWFIYFMLVYMIADLGCQAGWGQVLVMGFNLVELLVVLSTIIAVLCPGHRQRPRGAGHAVGCMDVLPRLAYCS